MTMVEWHDVQGLILSGYLDLPYAAYIPWRIRAGSDAKAWLGQLIPRLMRADSVKAEPELQFDRPPRPTSPKAMKMLSKKGGKEMWVVNVALTSTGLRGLGVGDG